MFKKLISAYHQHVLKNASLNELNGLKFITPEMIDKGLDEPSMAVRWHWARHPNANTDNIIKALKDENPSVRLIALKHSSALVEHYILALSDSDSLIRHTAASLLQDFGTFKIVPNYTTKLRFEVVDE